jgi:hypothetical protein
MTDWEVWASRWDELRLYLHRQFWRPLRSMMSIFHVLPLAAVVILFVFLATDGQFREIYIAGLEGARHHTNAWIFSVAMSFAALTLISAVLYEAHNALSTMRINVVYSSYSDPTAASNLRGLQRSAAFVLAFLPWVGLSVGLFGARNFVADRYCHLLNSAGVKGAALESMQYLPVYGGYRIACAVIFLGLAVAYFSGVGEQHRMAQRAVACTALPVGALLFFLFTDLFDISHRSAAALIADIVIVAVTVLYLLVYQWLYRRRSGFIFSHLTSGIGISLRKRRRHWLAMWAFMPWLALAAYFVCAQYVAGPLGPVTSWQQCPVASYPTPGRWAIFPAAMCVTIALGLIVGHTLGRLSAYKWRRPAICVIVALLVLAVELLSFFGGVDRAVYVYRFIGPLGTVLLELLFLISTFALLAVLSQRSGFPALTLAALTMVISVMFPNYAGVTAIALAAVYLAFALAGFLSRQYAVGFVGLLLPLIVFINWNPLHSETVTAQNQQPVAGTVTTIFNCWLEFRGVVPVAAGQQPPDCSAYGTPPPAAARVGKYPVFIIAAEGGGIYAASAISTLLAKLQDAEPEFSKHVFAISGVSGGSLGAAVFRALDHRLITAAAAPARKVQPPGNKVSDEDDATTCAQYVATERAAAHPASAKDAGTFLQNEVANIMRGDHFSPVVGSIVPEIFGSPLTRSKALVASFDYSASAQDAEAGELLCAPFSNSWSPASNAPGLVLNATWVETGFRVAFAPFDLHATDESLYSFSDVGMPDERQANLMGAASVSARFPLIMPPFSAVMQNPDKANPNKMDTKRWNFVDGAYSDNSGASTAIDIYRVIKDTPSVDLHIILITSTNPAPSLDDASINGTVFRDTVAPLDALMKVRSDLGDQAVARACTSIYSEPVKIRSKEGVAAAETNAYCVNQSWRTDGAARLQIVEIQDQTYGLALGWKISATTFAVVKWMLGTPDGCSNPAATASDSDNQSAAGTENPAKSESSSDMSSPADQAASKETTQTASAEDPNAQLTKAILRRNSCVLTSVVTLVRDAEAAASQNKNVQ